MGVVAFVIAAILCGAFGGPAWAWITLWACAVIEGLYER